MRKIIFLIIFMLIFPVTVKASRGDLIYGVEDVNFDGNNMVIQGWAYPDRINSIGGQSYIVNVIAVKRSDVVSYGASNYASFSKKLVKTSSEYSGFYMLYPKTCFRDNTGDCVGKFYGANGDSWDHGTSYLTCIPSDYNTGCMYYNPNFKVTFSNTELQNMFGDSEITFLIELKYYDFGHLNRYIPGVGYVYGINIWRRNTSISSSDSNSSCDYSYDGVVKKTSYYNGESYSMFTAYDEDCNAVNNPSITLSVAIKELTFDASCLADEDIVGSLDVDNATNVTTASINWSGFSEVRIKMPNKFYFKGGSKALFLDSLGSKYSLTSGCSGDGCKYFPDTTPYYTSVIDRSKTQKNVHYNDADLGTLANGTLNLYFDDNYDRYMWSAWGTFNGRIILSLAEETPEPPPLESCNNYFQSNSCSVSSSKITTSDCSKKYVDITFKTTEVNTGVCKTSGTPGTVTVRKVYKFSEDTKLDVGDIFTTTSKPYPGLKLDNEIKFDFTRILKWNEYSTDVYYSVVRHVETISGCVEQPALYVTDTYLKNNLLLSSYDTSVRNAVDKYDLLYPDEDLFEDAIEKHFKQGDSELKYTYPSSNDVSESYKDTDSDGVIYRVTDLDDRYDVKKDANQIDTKVEYKIKNAFVDSVYGNGHIVYDDDGSIWVGYNNVGKYYFIPFNVSKGDILTFMTGRNDVSVLIDNINLESNCELTITDNGPISNYMYRVIDITNPFPNFKPGELDSNGKQRAKNWETIWNDSLKFDSGNNLYLFDRYNDLNAEKYTANLKPSNIDLIRVYNNTNSYIKSSINDIGESIYINNNTGTGKIFTRNFPLFKKVSESGVE